MRTPPLLLALAMLAAPRLDAWEKVELPTSPGDSRTWYRCRIQVPDRLVVPEGNPRDLWRSSTMLVLGDLPHGATVFLNGKSIVTAGRISAGETRRFKVPKDLFVKQKFNTLVVRVDRDGLSKAPMIIDYFNELHLGPEWEASNVEPPAAEFQPVEQDPASASYTPANFRLSATPLDSTAEPIPGRRLAPEKALAALETDNDLAVEQLLHEPQVAQPTHISFDARGRMWVSQYRQYPYPKGVKMLSRDQYYRSKYDRIPPAPPYHDKGADIISVHEDVDRDGTYEKQTKILEGLNMANAALRGWGGFWVMHTPYLLFYPDADGDDEPDRAPEIRLEGFGLEDTHSVANGLTWGPDGWLYGGQGSTTTSRVRRPGVDAQDFGGVYNEGCHVWRYHPRSKEFELFADGGGNIFGLSFDGEGRLFVGHNGGSTRGWHMIQGGNFLKQGKNPGKFGPPPNPYAFGELPMMRSTNPIPRFSNMSVLAGGTALPQRLRGRFLCVDPLHHNIVAAERRALGSSFETTDLGFPLRTKEVTFRPVYLNNAPDGSIVIADFCEQYIAHGQNYQGQIDPSSGRIYRLRGKAETLETDYNLEGRSNSQLVETLSHPNLWHRHTAARLLGQRRDQKIVPDLIAALGQPGDHPAVDALWSLHQMDALTEDLATRALAHPSAIVRAWAVRLVGDAGELPDHFAATLGTIAEEEPDAEVRCQILSTAGRLPVEQGLQLIQEVTLPAADADDPYIPLMLWFVIESHCAENRERILEMFEHDELWSRPVIQKHIIGRLMRRFAEAGTRADFLTCARLLKLAPSPRHKAALVAGLERAFEGRIPPELPPELVSATGRGSLSMRIRQGDEKSIGRGLDLLESEKPERIEAIHAFGTRALPDALPRLVAIATGASSPDHRRAALNSLQIYADPKIAKSLIDSYPDQPAELQPNILNLLASRKSWATELARSKAIPDKHFTADVRARISLHGLDASRSRSEPAGTAKVEAITKILRAQPGDAYRGEPIYQARCASCHRAILQGAAASAPI